MKFDEQRDGTRGPEFGPNSEFSKKVQCEF